MVQDSGMELKLWYNIQTWSFSYVVQHSGMELKLWYKIQIWSLSYVVQHSGMELMLRDTTFRHGA